MAYSIGDVSFGVDAQTRGLKKAISDLEKFRAVVNSTARSQAKGASQAAAALGRQESAIKRSFQQVLNLRRAYADLAKAQQPVPIRAAARDQLAQLSIAFRRLTKDMTSGKLSSVEFMRAMDAFTARSNRVRRSLQEINNEVTKTSKGFGKMSVLMRDLESSTILAVGPLSGLGARIRSFGAIVNRSNLGLAALLGGVVATATGFFLLARGALRASVVFERMEARFLAAGQGAQVARKQMAYVIQTSERLGLRIEDTGAAFSRLTAATAGTSLEGQGTRDVFEGIAVAAAAMRLEATEVEGIFRAVEQMISKGTVAAEELRGQMGERLPGAFNLAAESMGVTTDKLGDMLKKGELAMDEFLIPFTNLLKGRFGEAAARNVFSFTGAMNNLSNAVLRFNLRFDQVFGVGSVAVFGINLLTKAINTLRRNLVEIIEVAGAVAGIFAGMFAVTVIRNVLLLTRAILVMVGALRAAAVVSTAAQMAMTRGLAGLAAGLIGAGIAFKVVDSALEDVEADIGDLDSTLDNLGKNDGPAKVSDNLQDVFDDLEELIAKTKEYDQAINRLKAGGYVDFAEAFLEASEMVRDLNSGELEQLREKLLTLPVSFGWEHDTTVDILARIVQDGTAVKEVFDDLVTSIRKGPEAMREYTMELVNLQGKYEALAKGPRALELFEREEQKAKALERMLDRLEEAYPGTGENAQKVTELMAEYEQWLTKVMTAEDKFITTSQDFASAITQAFDDAIFSGEKLSDIISSLEKQLLQIAVRTLVLRPFEQYLSGTFGNILGNNLGGPQAAANATGGAFRNGIKFMAKGGILDGPTFFGTKGGLAVAGEAGSEAVLPLQRGRNGNLGVAANGMSSSPVIVNIYDQRSGGGPVEVKESSDSQGRRQLDIYIRETVHSLVDSGNLDKPMQRNFGLSRKGTR